MMSLNKECPACQDCGVYWTGYPCSCNLPLRCLKCNRQKVRYYKLADGDEGYACYGCGYIHDLDTAKQWLANKAGPQR